MGQRFFNLLLLFCCIAFTTNVSAQSKENNIAAKPLAVADATITINDPSIGGSDVDLSACKTGSGTISLNLTIGNNGTVPLPATANISYYNGDPFNSAAQFIAVESIGESIAAGNSITKTVTLGDQNGDALDLFILVNHDGTGINTPLTAYNFDFSDSDTTNNLFSLSLPGCIEAVDDIGFAVEDAGGLQDVVSNDLNPSGNVTTVTVLQPGNSGNSTFAPPLYLFYVPNTNFSGQDTAVYKICFTNHPTICDTAQIIWTVANSNDQPDAVNDVITIDEDNIANGDLSTNDTDPDPGEVLIYTTTPVSSPNNGNVVIQIDGTYTYTPDPDFNGSDSFSYQVCDDDISPLCDEAIVSITVNPVNDRPRTQADAVSTDEDTPVSGNTSTNDIDVENDQLIYNTTPVASPLNGDVILNADGSFTYTPDQNFNGTDFFDYEVCDDGTPSGCDTNRVTITINAVNDEPDAVDDGIYILDEDDSLSDDVSTNDSDIEGHSLSYSTTPVSGPDNGNVSLNANGTFTYTPNGDYFGADSFIYEVCDNGTPSECSQASVQFTINPINDKPIAADDNFNTNEDITLAGSLNATDVDDTDLVFNTTPVSDVNNGTLNINVDGSFEYTPDNDFNGVDVFQFAVCDDGTPALCDTASITINVNAVNDAPDLIDDNFIVNEDENLNDDLSPNDSDKEGNNITYTATAVSGPGNGNVVINADGTFTYTPLNNFNGNDSFDYEACDDGLPSACDTATVFIVVDPVNDKPDAVADAFNVSEDGTLGTSLTANDIDIDGDNLIMNTTPVVDVNNGSLVLNADGSFTYEPDANFNGNDNFSYAICDDGIPSLCDTTNVVVTVNAVNDKPNAVDDAFAGNEDESVNGDLSLNDNDIEGDLLIYSSTAVSGPSNGSVTINNDGTFVYTPDNHFNGNDQFVYEVCDNGLPSACSTATATISLTPVPDKPVANDDNVATTPGAATLITVQDNDEEYDGETLITSIISGPSNGSASVVANTNINYTSIVPFLGTADTIVYAVCDPGGLCDTATVFIDVETSQLAPLAVNDQVSTNEDESVLADVLSNDSDQNIGDVLSVNNITSGPSNGTATIIGNQINYEPDPNFNGIDLLMYEVCDNSVATLCSTAELEITVQSINDAPVIVTVNGQATSNLTFDMDENTTLEFVLSATDVDADIIDITAVNLFTANANVSGISDGDTAFTYIPVADYVGTENVEVLVCDNGNPVLCDTVELTITINAVNGAPIANDDAESTELNTPVTIDVQDNDSDPEGDLLTTSIVTQPSNGTAITNGNSIDYTPSNGFTGSDSFEYAVCDPSGACDTAEVLIFVDLGDQPPLANDDVLTMSEDDSTGIDPLNNDTDPNNDPITLSSISVAPIHGTAVISGNDISYKPDPDFFGEDSLSYLVCDNTVPTPLCDAAIVRITVSNVNDKPTFPNDTIVRAIDRNEVLSETLTFTDIDGDVVDITAALSLPNNGTVGSLSDGDQAYTYTPDTDFSGIDTFSLLFCDFGAPQLCDQVVVIVRVNATNTAPVAVDDQANAVPGQAVFIDVQANDSDADGDDLTTTILRAPSNGSANVVDGDGITYIPDGNFEGQDTLEYIICDASNACDTAQVIIDVAFGDMPPVAGDDFELITEDIPANFAVLINDTDVNGDVLQISAIAISPLQGVATIQGDQINYVPNPNYTGSDQFDYVVCDQTNPTPLCDTGTVFIFVAEVNDAPQIVNTSLDKIDTVFVTTDENTAIDITLFAQDVDGDATDVVSTPVAPGNGVVTNLGGNDMKFTYTPNQDFFGTETFSAEVCDDGNPTLCDTVVVHVTINELPNNAPIATDDVSATDPNESIIIDVQINDTDLDGDVLITSVIQDPSKGTAVVQNADSILYTPEASFVSGTDTLYYSVCDPENACDTAQVIIHVPNGPLPPIAGNDFYTINEDEFGTFDVLTNDIDPNGDILFLGQIVQSPANGNFSINGNSIFYLPQANYFGEDSLKYEVCDGTSCDTGTVYITINSVNDAPVFALDVFSFSLTAGDSIPLNFVASDVEGDSLDIVYVDQTHILGTIYGIGDGDFSISYESMRSVSGTFRGDVVVCDNGNPELCDTATLELIVDPAVNNAPNATDDLATTDLNVEVIIDVQANDIDADGDALITTIVTGPQNGTASVINDDSISYTPSIAVGTDTIIYSVCDEFAACDTATVIIVMPATNLPPIAVNDTVETNEETSINISVLANDQDPNGNIISVNTLGDPQNGTVSILNNDITYTPDLNYTGQDSFSYEVCDDDATPLCDTAIVVINVANVNDKPTITDSLNAIEDTLRLSLQIGATYDYNAGFLDIDGDNVSWNAVIDPTNLGTVSGIGDQDMTFSYIANNATDGIDIFRMTACDDGVPSLCDTVVVVATILGGPNQAPVAVNDVIALEVPIDTLIDVTANDSDPDGDLITALIISNPGRGSVSMQNNSILYEADLDFTTGFDTIVYAICDSEPLCDTALVIISMAQGDLAPIAENDTFNLVEDEQDFLLVLQNDVDLNADPLTLTQTIIEPQNGTAVIINDSILFTPDENFFGPEFFTYEVCDNTQPTPLCDTAAVVIIIENVNDAPQFVDTLNNPISTITIAVNLNEAHVTELNALDIDGDSVSLAQLINGPSHGTIDSIDNENLIVRYTPDFNYLGFDSVNFIACDNGSPTLCDTLLVIYHVQEIITNGTPIVNPDFIATDPGITVEVNVLANDIEPDGEEMILSIMADPVNGTASLINGNTISYTPDPGFIEGTDTVHYQVCDTNGACASTYLVIFVPNEPLPPIGVDDHITIMEEESVFIKVLFNDTDPNGELIFINGIVTTPENGVLLPLGDSIRYTPNENFFGTDTFEYRVCDNSLMCDTALVTVEVININDNPQIVDSSGADQDTLFITSRKNFLVEIEPLVNDVDFDEVDVLTMLQDPLNGVVSGLADGDGKISYQPNISYVGGDTLRIELCDNGIPNLCDSLVVLLNILDEDNTAPVAVDDIYLADPGDTLFMDVQANDSDAEGDPFITTILSGPQNGIATVINDSGIEFRIDTAFKQGVDTIVYVVCDGGQLCDTATALIFVPSSSQPPVGTDDDVEVLEDDTVIVNVLVNDFDPNQHAIRIDSILSQPANGTLIQVNDSSFAYIPHENYNGTDQFSYLVCDSEEMCDSATVNFTVIPVNDLPIAIDDTAETNNSIPTVINVTANDIDIDGDVDLSLTSILVEPANGSVVLLEDGEIEYAPSLSFVGSDQFSYLYCDSISCDTAVVYINILPFDGFFISEGITPNGDGSNDVFIVRGIENYPDNEVTIVNRWGNVVFKQSGYTIYENEKVWKGTDESGGALSDGTYFYIIKLNDAAETVKSGSIELRNAR